MKLSHYFSFLCFGMCSAGASALTTHYDQIVDTPSGYLVESPVSGSSVTIEQTFVPTFSKLNFIELNVAVEPEGTSRFINLRIFQGSELVTEALSLDLLKPNCTSDDPPYSCPIANSQGSLGKRLYLEANLIPGEEYRFSIESTHPIILARSDNYELGSLFVDGIEQQAQDLWFKTGFESDLTTYDPSRFWATGQVTDIIELDAGSAPVGVNVGDPVTVEFSLPDGGALIAVENSLSVYAPDYALETQITINNQLIWGEGSLAGVGNDIVNGALTQDMVVTRYDRIRYSDLPAGEESFDVHIRFLDNTGTALSSNELGDHAAVSQMPGQVIIQAIDATGQTQSGSLIYEAGYIVVTSLDSVAPATVPHYQADYSVNTAPGGYVLSGLSGQSYAWISGLNLLGIDEELDLPLAAAEQTVVKHYVVADSQSRAKVYHLAGPDGGLRPYSAQQVVQLIDSNADGSVDEVIHNPPTVKIGRDATGIYSASLYALTPTWLEPLMGQVTIVSAPQNALTLAVSADYHTEYTNLGVPAVGRSLGNVTIDPQFSGELSFPLFLDPFLGITSRETSFYLHGATTGSAVVELDLRAGSTILQEGTATSSASSSIAQSSSLASSSNPSSQMSSSLVASSSSAALSSSSSSSSSVLASSRSSSETSSIAVSSSSSTPLSSSSVSSSSSSESTSSISESSRSQAASSSSSPSAPLAQAECSFHVGSQWSQGFVASIRIKNVSTSPIEGWSVNWDFVNGASIVGSWNANISGTGPYQATGLSWNSTIYPGQTVEFGMQGSKSTPSLTIPDVFGDVCQ